MRPRFPACLSLAGALFAAAGSAENAAAQQRLPDLISVVTADSLHESAVALVQTSHRWRDAARLHRRSAELRPAEDPLGFRCLQEAAQISYAARDITSARDDMERAAEHALSRGDLRSAALAYVDAAWLAQEQKKIRLVWDLGHRAEMLAASPLLGASDQRAILSRIVRVPSSPALAIRGAR